MIPGSPSFLTETVAKTKNKRQTFRIFAMSICMCLAVSLASGQPIADALIFSAIDGTAFGVMVFLIRRVVPNVKFSSFGYALLFRSFAYTLVLILSLALVGSTVKNGYDLIEFFERHRGALVLFLIYFYLQTIVVTGLRGISRKLGPGAFWNWIRGYYYTPKEEERIFMFLDMRRSTELAEQLGDLKFSTLVQDFFDDLTGPIIETRAEVSHYIGDEAVLTWWPSKGLPDARCLQCFFRMQAIIDRRRAYYMEKYGVVPEFKAGAHIGRVVATEVGKIKSEIVFHGDVLNTTARVQGACGEFGAELLITEALSQRLPQTTWLDLQPIGDVALKGKSEKVKLLSAAVKTK